MIVIVLVTASYLYSNYNISPYSIKAAKQDIESGNAKIYSIGLSDLHYFTEVELDFLYQKYGFREIDLGCMMSDANTVNQIVAYNKYTGIYLEKRNGNNWQENYHTDFTRMLKDGKLKEKYYKDFKIYTKASANTVQ